MLKHKTSDQLQKMRKKKVSITAFIVKRPENFAYDLANTLQGLEIVFSFTKFLFCSPQVLSHCIKPNIKSVTYTSVRTKLQDKTIASENVSHRYKNIKSGTDLSRTQPGKRLQKTSKECKTPRFHFYFYGQYNFYSSEHIKFAANFWVKAVPSTLYQLLSNKFRSFD